MKKHYLTRDHKKTIALSSLGGTLEFYDFIIFIFFASTISKLFFPAAMDSFWSSLNTYATFAAGYFARPLGGIVMAHFGDKFGRKNMFMLSILLMVIPTFIIGVMPTFEHIGYAATIVLIIIRILQGIAIGGELPGAWTFVSEHVRRRHLGISIGILTSSVAGGILLGSIVVFIIRSIYSDIQVDSYAWRIPFILGGVFGIISVFLRRYLEETPIFKEMKNSDNTVKFPLAHIIKTSKRGIVLSIGVTWILTACIVIMVLLLPVNFSTLLAITKKEAVLIQMVGIALTCTGCVIFGIFNDRLGTRSSGVIFGLCLFIISSLLFSKLFNLESRTFLNIFDASNNTVVYALYFICCLIGGGLTAFAPLVMIQIFPSNIKFSGIGFSYNVGYAIFGGLTPIFFQIALNIDNAFLYYFMFISLLVLACAFILNRCRVSYEDI